MAGKKKKGQAITQKKAPAAKDNSWIIPIAAVLGLVLIIVLAVVITNAVKNAQKNDLDFTSNTTDAGDTQSENASAGTETMDFAGDVYADITVKDYGTITLQLAPEIAPITVTNFVKLANSGFYDGLTFHRIMEGFMIQGGDPQGNGFGGSDETIKGEFSANGVENNISHVRGVISMARSSDMDSASSQFFIVHEDSTFLDGNYAAFGRVTEGMDVVDKIAADAEPIDDNGTIPADKQPVIESIKIR